MAEEKKVVTLDDFEQRLMVSGLMDFRNDLPVRENLSALSGPENTRMAGYVMPRMATRISRYST